MFIFFFFFFLFFFLFFFFSQAIFEILEREAPQASRAPVDASMYTQIQDTYNISNPTFFSRCVFFFFFFVALAAILVALLSRFASMFRLPDAQSHARMSNVLMDPSGYVDDAPVDPQEEPAIPLTRFDQYALPNAVAPKDETVI